MNIVGYIKKFGHQSFLKKPFNNADALILATLSYLNFELLIDNDESLLIKNIPENFMARLCAGEFIAKQNEEMTRLLKYSKRYQDIEIKYIRNVHDKLNTIQFFAITMIIPNYHPFICFRGTDLTLVGWKEDLMLAVHDVVPSQIEALNYVNYISERVAGPISIAGHSKGGNLAMFASIHAISNIQNRLDKVYVFDGPGFRDDKIFSTDKYLRVKNKIIQFVPQDDIVGAIFFTPKDKFIIKSRSVHFLQHNPYFWFITKKGDFKYLKKESVIVKIRRRTMILWVNSLNLEECEFMIDKIVNSLGGVESSLSYRLNLMFIKFKNFIHSHFGYSKAARKRLSNSAALYLKILRESQKYYLKHPNED